MAQAARVFGKPVEIEFRGEKYQIAPLNLDMLAMFEAWLENRAFARVEVHRDKLNPIIYQERLDAVARLVATEAFGFGGELAAKASRGREGGIFLLWLQLTKNHADVDEGFVSELWDEMAGEIAIRERAAAGTDPNAETPATN